MTSFKIALAAAFVLAVAPALAQNPPVAIRARDHPDDQRRRLDLERAHPRGRGSDDPPQPENALRPRRSRRAYRREAGVVHRRRRSAGRGERTQGHGSAHLSRGHAGDRRGLPPLRPRAEKLDDQRQHLRPRRRDDRPQAHRDLQGRRADHRRRPEDADRRASSLARRPISSPARRSSRAGPSRRTARSTPASSWSARMASSRPCDRAQPNAAKRSGICSDKPPVLAVDDSSAGRPIDKRVVEFPSRPSRIRARLIRYSRSC